MLNARDFRIISKLTALCAENTVDLRCRHVSALADKNRIISIGMNSTRTCPWFYKYSRRQAKQYQHSEWNCLKNLKGDFRRTTLYVVRLDRQGQWNNSKPCEICSKIIKDKNISRVVHSIENGVVECAF